MEEICTHASRNTSQTPSNKSSALFQRKEQCSELFQRGFRTVRFGNTSEVTKHAVITIISQEIKMTDIEHRNPILS